MRRKTLNDKVSCGNSCHAGSISAGAFNFFCVFNRGLNGSLKIQASLQRRVRHDAGTARHTSADGMLSPAVLKSLRIAS